MNTTRDRLKETYPATERTVPRVRDAITRFVQSVGVDGRLLEDIRLAVTEAVTNVVRHAYPDQDGEVELTAGFVRGEVWILISDHGRGHLTPSPNPGLGYGLAVMADACRDFAIAERANGGTEVRLHFELDR